MYSQGLIEMALRKHVPMYGPDEAFTPDNYLLDAVMLATMAGYLLAFTDGTNTSYRVCPFDTYLELKKKFEEVGGV